jgi:tight adherence protein C
VILLGALAAATASAAFIVGVRGASTVERRLRAIGIASGPHVFGRLQRDPLAASKIGGALAGALIGCAASAVGGVGLMPVIVSSYAGYVLPSVFAERRAARRRTDAEHAVVTLVEFLHAVVASGRPLETALASVATRSTGSGSALLDGALGFALRDYTLGVPMHVALARHGGASGVHGLTELASRIERARDLGRGVLPLLQDLRDELRAEERARGLAAASHVEGKLTLVLTLCYLPALALLVIIPLFLTLLAGLFG